MKKLLIPIFLLTVLFAFSQKQLEQKTNTLLTSDNFHTFRLEKFFLHTNKSVYFSGENIWFKAYVVDNDTNLPSLETTNLYVNLYGPDKTLISTQLFYVENGMTNGEILLEETFNSGSYYIQLDTQWNRNFKKGTVFKIEVENLKNTSSETDTQVNEVANSENNVVSNSNDIISFFPESQVLLDDVQNMIIFSSKKNVKGLVIDDKTGKPVAALRSNEFGVGAFKINQNSTYYALLEVGNDSIRIPLPKPVKKGFIIHKITGSYGADIIDFQLSTNDYTLKDYKDSYVFAVLHRNGSVKSIAPIQIVDGVKDYKLSLLKQDIFNGLNTITLFNENNQPISERDFYWQTDNIADIDFIKDKQVGDSLNLNINLINKVVPINLSVSVLPKNTQLHVANYSILSSFLLTPYLTNNFPVADPNSLSNSEMDFLLQSLNRNAPLPYKKLKQEDFIYKNENGVTIKGTVNASIENPKNYSVMLTSKVNNLLEVQPLEKDKSFEFNRLLLKHPTRYQLALLDKKGEIVKAKFFVFNNYTDYKANTVLNVSVLKAQDLESIESKNSESAEFDLSLPEYDDVEQLDEVVIKADKIRENQEKRKKLAKSGVQGIAFSKIYEPRTSPYAKGDILQFLRTIPGTTVKYTQDNTPYLNNERYRRTINNAGDAPFTIILDGSPIGTDLSIIDFRMASEFEYIIVNYRGGGYGALFPLGVINMVTLKGNTGDRVAKPNPNIQMNDSQFGFNMPRSRYEKPIFQFPNYETKENFETLDWIPNLIVKPNVYNKLKINVEDSNGVKLIINGLSANGDLFYKIIDID